MVILVWASRLPIRSHSNLEFEYFKKNEMALDLYAISYRWIYLFDYRIDIPILLKNVLQHHL